MRTTIVYLLHRDGDMPERHHARHYLGSAVQLEGRLQEHASGGARLTQVWNALQTFRVPSPFPVALL